MDLRRRLGVCVALVVMVAFAGGALPAASRADDVASCQGADVAVSALATPATMHGTLCVPDGASPTTAMVLVPGATYNHTYWDFPYEPQTYNFRLVMNEAGYATFVVDRLGTGQSSRPPSASLTATVQAGAIHDVIGALRAGRIGGRSFAKVILGGHSEGSAISIIEASKYNDENALLLTGIAHAANPQGGVQLYANSLYPAPLDPAFAGKGYDAGYLTTEPGTRAADFYAPATTDPHVLAVDEKTKDVTAATETPDTIAFGVLATESVLIKAPVLLADGADDQDFCMPLTDNCASAAALRASEAPYYSSSPCLEAYVLPGAGHSINLATDTGSYQQRVRTWANAFVGATGTSAPAADCPQ